LTKKVKTFPQRYILTLENANACIDIFITVSVYTYGRIVFLYWLVTVTEAGIYPCYNIVFNSFAIRNRKISSLVRRGIGAVDIVVQITSGNPILPPSSLSPLTICAWQTALNNKEDVMM
jgi:hypothetical protein